MFLALLFFCLIAHAISQISQRIVDDADFGIRDSRSKGVRCCSLLKAALGDKISLPGSPVYAREQNGSYAYWSAFESEVSPSCRLTPVKINDVSVAVSMLARQNCMFAIRGGGHMWWAGAANIQDGVTIDLSDFTKVEISHDKTVTLVGGGARWEDVYYKLDATNLSVVGGRVHDVGVGGLTLGGGNSWFAPRYGFVCDNVVNFEIVVASGQILNVNKSSHADLFKALKGGGNNFGVVTRFDLKTFQQGKLWGGFIIYPWNSTTDSSRQLRYLEAYGMDSQEGLGEFATVENLYIFNGTKPFLLGNILVDSRAQAYPGILQNFTDAKPQLLNTLRTTNLTDLTIEAGGGQAKGGVRGSDPAGGIGNGGRYIWASATFVNNAITLAHILSLVPIAFSFPSHGTVSPSLSLQPVTKAYTRHAASSGGNSLGLGPDPGSTVWMNFACTSHSPADDAAVLNATKTFIRLAQHYTKSQNQHIEFIYSNYALPFQDPIASYGDESQEFLRIVSKKYDPQQVFQKLVPGGFKLYGRGKA